MRLDLQAPVHKGLRGALADALLAIGRMDPGDECEVREAHARLEEVLLLCEQHAERENAIVNRAIEARRAGASAAFALDHVRHADAVDALRAMAARRDGRLYSAFAAFMADMLRHMSNEEWDGDATLRALFGEAELGQMQRRVDASLAAPEGMPLLRWMIPALSHGERIELLERLGAVSHDAFEAALALARMHLCERDFARLAAHLRGDGDGGRQRDAATLAS